MNSEELEISLRTEFENYLKDVFAEMRQEVSQLQEKAEAELESCKKQLDGIFREALSHTETARNFDAGFRESVVEHLRQARDEGARITATAIAEAEEIEKQKAAATAGIKELNAAVNDISEKNSQPEILKSLVHHASQFAPRGAFFIVKNEHFVGWRTFSREDGKSTEAIREVFLPVASDSILSEAVRSLAAVESNSETYTADAEILKKLEFGSPNKMFAIPLIARGRGVAVLYADYGAHGGEVNLEALETMVQVAGLTVEILASSRGTSPKKKTASERKSAPEYSEKVPSAEPVQETAQSAKEFVYGYQSPATEAGEITAGNQYGASFKSENSEAGNHYLADSESSENNSSSVYSGEQMYESEPKAITREFPNYSYSDNSSDEDETLETAVEDTENSVQTNVDYTAHENSKSNQPAENFAATEENYTNSEQNFFETPSWNQPVEPQSYQNFSESPVNDSQTQMPPAENFETFAPQVETYAPVIPETNQFENEIAKTTESFAAPPSVTATPAKSRFSDRNVDLPIEVSEDERRLHNDARRFARLLVSEIKLYNEQKVKEGRDANDLYERLREAIDRSREMYDKRVQPPVVAKFDYFHYELVNTLAEGDNDKLGASYPGATV